MVVLCRKCAHTVSPAMARCPRCGFAAPYWRSRRWRIRLNLAGAARGKECPRCGRPTTRRPSPAWVKPIRLATMHRCSYRTCEGCGWHGVAFHARTLAGQHRPA
jgi:hypothetical protein